VAVGHSLNRIGGRFKNGNKTDFWLRSTMCFQKINGTWLIVHDHASVPLDPASGEALLNLEPRQSAESLFLVRGAIFREAPEVFREIAGFLQATQDAVPAAVRHQ
jgi:SnoaL-like domain